MTIPSIFTEAEYAYQLRKQIIPLMMEPRFQPRGWLGIIAGTKLWMDFREARNLEAGTSHLVRELGKLGKSQGRFNISLLFLFFLSLVCDKCELETVEIKLVAADQFGDYIIGLYNPLRPQNPRISI